MFNKWQWIVKIANLVEKSASSLYYNSTEFGACIIFFAAVSVERRSVNDDFKRFDSVATPTRAEREREKKTQQTLEMRRDQHVFTADCRIFTAIIFVMLIQFFSSYNNNVTASAAATATTSTTTSERDLFGFRGKSKPPKTKLKPLVKTPKTVTVPEKMK